MNRIVVACYEFFKIRRVLFYSILIILFAVLGFFSSRVALQKDITKMIPDDEETAGYKSAIQNVRILDKIIVSFEADSAGMEDSLIACAENFVEALRADTTASSLVSDIRYRIDEERMSGIYDLIYSNLPIYLTAQDYKRIDSITTDTAVKKIIEQDYHKLISPASVVLKQYVLKDPLSISSSAFSKLQGMQAEDNYTLHNGYIFRKDKKTLVVFLTPLYPGSNTEVNGVLIDGIDKARDQTKLRYSQFDVTYFGSSAVAVSNARQIESDIKVIATVSLIIILSFLFFFYRSWSLPILMITPVAFGGVFSLGLIYFIQGSVSAIALGAGSVIIGIALDYSFHVFAHYQHTRNIRSVVNDVAVPMMIGSISTVGAFFSLLYVHSDILSDFGLFAGLSLIGASLFSLFFLPHLIESFAKPSENEEGVKHRKMEFLLIKFIALKPEANKWFIALVLVLTGIFVYYSNWVTFDSDLSQINYMPQELKAAENKLYQTDTGSGKTVFFIFRGKDISEALYRNEHALKVIDSLKEDVHIHRYAGISGLLPSDSIQLQRIAYWNAYWTPEKIAQVKAYITKYSVELGFNANAFEVFFEMLHVKHTVMNAEHRTFMQEVFLKDYVQSDSSGVALLASMRLPMTVSNDVYKPFDRIEGLTILDRQLFYNKFMLIVKEDFNQILMSSSLLVFMILLISYGRLELTLISFLPMLISWFWILGLMGIFDIHFNIVNIIISTFVFGLGDDYSIFITDGLQKKYTEGKDNLPSYKVSIFLSAFTTIIAMGALIFAKHPALKSIALISIIGIACVLLISNTIIPLLFRWFITDRTDKGKAPFTLAILLRSAVYILLACVLCFIVAVHRLMFRMLGLVLGNKLDRKLYKWFFNKAVNLFVFCCFFMKKKKQHINLSATKSAIIISNDQSVLGILLLLSLSNRIVILKNDYTTKTYFSRVLLFLQDLKGANGLPDIKYVQALIAEGYIPILIGNKDSLEEELSVAFNEGIATASDIVPIVIVGTEHCLAKNDFVLNRGAVVLKQLPSVNSTTGLNAIFSEGYKEVLNSFSMSVHFNKILSSYIYKSPVLEWYYRIKVKLEKSYQPFDTLLPQKGLIYDLGCGYGFLDYFLNIKSPERTIIGVDYDGDKITVADNSYLKNSQLTFIESDVMALSIQHADAVVILDVLHYLSAENQKKLIRSAFEGLNTGGILIIRDGDSSQIKKHKGTKLTEFFSTKLVMFNKTEEELCFFSSQAIIETLKDFNVEVKILDETKYTSNVVYYVVKQ
ncbi:MMPL family transporter [Cytophaga aurantiaca]|uniref:MMPL family transporter n=1 Tax=Cytophaga aurantiaca TaxID=29530 RepID=UPI00036F0877|nr:MMPL family transporter [Cytophaga aurantiaca]